MVFVLFQKQPILGALMFFSLGIVFQELIIAQLIFVTLFESALIVESGITIGKLLTFLYVVYFIVFIIIKKLKLKFRNINYIIIFSIISIIGLLNVLFNQEVINFAGGAKTILTDVFLKYMPRILFFILINIYIKNKGINFIKESILNVTKTVNYFIIILLIYFTLNFQIASWFNLVDRFFLENIDPNEFSIIIISFIPFVAFNLIKKKHFYLKILSFAAYGIIFYLTILTASRSGFITFIFATFIIIYFFGFIKISNRSFFTTIGLLVVIIIVLDAGIIDIDKIFVRFTFYGNDLSMTTARRVDFWKNAIELFPHRPFIGYGLSPFASRYYNGIGTGTPNVMHNIFIQTLFQLGLFGLISLILLLKHPFENKILFKLREKDKVLLQPYLSFLILLFGGMSLSWLWRELIWIYLAVCYAITNLILYEDT